MLLGILAGILLVVLPTATAQATDYDDNPDFGTHELDEVRFAHFYHDFPFEGESDAYSADHAPVAREARAGGALPLSWLESHFLPGMRQLATRVSSEFELDAILTRMLSKVYEGQGIGVSLATSEQLAQYRLQRPPCKGALQCWLDKIVLHFPNSTGNIMGITLNITNMVCHGIHIGRIHSDVNYPHHDALDNADPVDIATLKVSVDDLETDCKADFSFQVDLMPSVHDTGHVNVTVDNSTIAIEATVVSLDGFAPNSTRADKVDVKINTTLDFYGGTTADILETFKQQISAFVAQTMDDVVTKMVTDLINVNVTNSISELNEYLTPAFLPKQEDPPIPDDVAKKLVNWTGQPLLNFLDNFVNKWLFQTPAPIQCLMHYLTNGTGNLLVDLGNATTNFTVPGFANISITSDWLELAGMETFEGIKILSLNESTPFELLTRLDMGYFGIAAPIHLKVTPLDSSFGPMLEQHVALDFAAKNISIELVNRPAVYKKEYGALTVAQVADPSSSTACVASTAYSMNSTSMFINATLENISVHPLKSAEAEDDDIDVLSDDFDQLMNHVLSLITGPFSEFTRQAVYGGLNNILRVQMNELTTELINRADITDVCEALSPPTPDADLTKYLNFTDMALVQLISNVLNNQLGVKGINSVIGCIWPNSTRPPLHPFRDSEKPVNPVSFARAPETKLSLINELDIYQLDSFYEFALLNTSIDHPHELPCKIGVGYNASWSPDNSTNATDTLSLRHEHSEQREDVRTALQFVEAVAPLHSLFSTEHDTWESKLMRALIESGHQAALATLGSELSLERPEYDDLYPGSASRIVSDVDIFGIEVNDWRVVYEKGEHVPGEGPLGIFLSASVPVGAQQVLLNLSLSITNLLLDAIPGFAVSVGAMERLHLSQLVHIPCLISPIKDFTLRDLSLQIDDLYVGFVLQLTPTTVPLVLNLTGPIFMSFVHTLLNTSMAQIQHIVQEQVQYQLYAAPYRCVGKEPPPLHPTTRTWALVVAFIALGALGSFIIFVFMYRYIGKRWVCLELWKKLYSFLCFCRQKTPRTLPLFNTGSINIPFLRRASSTSQAAAAHAESDLGALTLQTSTPNEGIPAEPDAYAEFAAKPESVLDSANEVGGNIGFSDVDYAPLVSEPIAYGDRSPHALQPVAASQYNLEGALLVAPIQDKALDNPAAVPDGAVPLAAVAETSLPETHAQGLFFHPAISPMLRHSVVFVVIANIATFAFSNSQVGAAVTGQISTPASSVNVGSLFDFTLVQTAKDMWHARTYLLFFLVAGLSGAWPYTKLVLCLAVWLLPDAVMSPRTREKLVVWLDRLGKWSLIDAFVLVLMVVAFRFHLKILSEDLSLDLIVQSKVGFYGLLASILVSLTLSHIILALHRHAVAPFVVQGGGPKVTLRGFTHYVARLRPTHPLLRKYLFVRNPLTGQLKPYDEEGSVNQGHSNRFAESYANPAESINFTPNGTHPLHPARSSDAAAECAGGPLHFSVSFADPAEAAGRNFEGRGPIFPEGTFTKITPDLVIRAAPASTFAGRVFCSAARSMTGRDASPDKTEGAMPKTPKVLVFTRMTLKAQILVVLGIVVSMIFLVMGSTLHSFVFTFKGLAGWLLADGARRIYSLVEVGNALVTSSMDPSDPGIRWIQMVYFVLILGAPLAYLISCLVLFAYPMTIRGQRAAQVVSEVLFAWAGSEVILVSLLAAVLQISTFAQFVIGDRCDLINAILEKYFKEPLDGDAKCFDLNAAFSGGVIYLLISAVLLLLIGQVISTAGLSALEDRIHAYNYLVRAHVASLTLAGSAQRVLATPSFNSMPDDEGQIPEVPPLQLLEGGVLEHSEDVARAEKRRRKRQAHESNESQSSLDSFRKTREQSIQGSDPESQQPLAPASSASDKDVSEDEEEYEDDVYDVDIAHASQNPHDPEFKARRSGRVPVEKKSFFGLRILVALGLLEICVLPDLPFSAVVSEDVGHPSRSNSQDRPSHSSEQSTTARAAPTHTPSNSSETSSTTSTTQQTQTVKTRNLGAGRRTAK